MNATSRRGRSCTAVAGAGRGEERSCAAAASARLREESSATAGPPRREPGKQLRAWAGLEEHCTRGVGRAAALAAWPSRRES
jgi:hypothetical protein